MHNEHMRRPTICVTLDEPRPIIFVWVITSISSVCIWQRWWREMFSTPSPQQCLFYISFFCSSLESFASLSHHKGYQYDRSNYIQTTDLCMAWKNENGACIRLRCCVLCMAYDEIKEFSDYRSVASCQRIHTPVYLNNVALSRLLPSH